MLHDSTMTTRHTPTPPSTTDTPQATGTTPDATTPAAPAMPDDGSRPLTTGRPTGRHERYAQLRVEGAARKAAYQATAPKRVRSRTAIERGSALDAQPNVARRIAWLTIQRDLSKQTLPPQAPQQHAKSTSGPTVDIKSLDRETILAALTSALNKAVKGSNSGAISASIREIRAFLPSLLHERDESMPDPLAVITYLCTAADKRPSDIRKELGGMDWVLARVQALTRCPPDQFIAAAQCVANAVAQREAKRVRR